MPRIIQIQIYNPIKLRNGRWGAPPTTAPREGWGLSLRYGRTKYGFNSLGIEVVSTLDGFGPLELMTFNCVVPHYYWLCSFFYNYFIYN